jgi:hypothetical protein
VLVDEVDGGSVRDRQGTLARIWQARRIRPRKVDTFKLSTDPSFESKLCDVVGLYVNPPAAAAVFCFDEKDPGPGSGPHPAVPADGAGEGRDDDPRPQERNLPRHPCVRLALA